MDVPRPVGVELTRSRAARRSSPTQGGFFVVDRLVPDRGREFFPGDGVSALQVGLAGRRYLHVARPDRDGIRSGRLLHPAWRLLAAVGVVAIVLATNQGKYKRMFDGLSAYYPYHRGRPVDLERYQNETFEGRAPVGVNQAADDSKMSRSAEGGAVERLVRTAAQRQAIAEEPAVTPRDHRAASLLLDDDQLLHAWLAGLSGQAPASPKLVVVAISGGAIRSAIWAGVVLNELGAHIKPFPRHVRIITGASGGMVGAAYYTVALYKNRQVREILTTGGQAIPTDSLEEVARRLTLIDIPSVFNPFPQTNDRGSVLEQTWPELDVTFFNLKPAEATASIPSMIFSPMLVEDGRRLLISNLDLTRMTEIYG